MKKHFIYFLLIFGISITQAQEKTIFGTIKDGKSPLAGVSITIKNTTKGTESDFDGNYKINAKIGAILIYRYLGYKTIEKTVSVENNIDINLVIDEDVHLDEIVVIGYGTKTKKSLTGTASGVSIADSYSISDSSSIIKSDKKQSGQLTAGEINDLNKWKEWQKLYKNNEFLKVKKDWGFSLENKVEIFVNDEDHKPITNANVVLLNSKNEVVSNSRTDIFGKSILFRNDTKNHTIQVIYKNKVKGLKITNNANKASFIFSDNSTSDAIDVMFTVDATGSMADEINYLKAEVESIISRVDKKIEQKRIGLTFYRDFGEDYVVRNFDFTKDIATIKINLDNQRASGGGDFEEAVEKALEVSLSQSWNIDAKAKLLFLLLDAPPHLNQENVVTIKNQIKIAQEKGIKIIPIVSSGANKTVEFLMRYFSVATNGTYVFLTDDSGIGNSHLKPSATDFKVEKLNDLIVRLIEKYSGIAS